MFRRSTSICVYMLFLFCLSCSQDNKMKNKEEDFPKLRDEMVNRQIISRGVKDSLVIQAMRAVPRHAFVPGSEVPYSYRDEPRPIGHKQTISQPYIVALMTQELKVNHGCEVLEIGTGSGYQTAVLAKLAKKVYTIERYEALLQRARATLSGLGIENVEFFFGDGTCGWPGEKKFNRIMITAAVEKMPQPLIDQLADGGVAIAPLGPWPVQDLVMIQKKDEKLTQRKICGCRFVRLIGKYGYDE